MIIKTTNSPSTTPRRAHRIGLAIVDDYPVVIAGLAALLEPFRDRVHLLALAPSESVDVILYDPFYDPLTPNEGLAVYVSSAIPVAVYTSIETPAAVAQSLAEGAAGYVHKGLTGARLVDAVERVHAGETVVELSSPAGNSWPGKAAGLTPRESQILAGICLGQTNEEIAKQAFLSINSVKTYVRTCYKKIGAQNRAQAVLWGSRNGFDLHEPLKLFAHRCGRDGGAQPPTSQATPR